MDSLVFQSLDKVNVGMVIIDKNLNILLWNQWVERLTGFKAEEVIGKSLTEICPRFRMKVYSEILQNVLFHGQSRFCSSTLHKAFFLPQDVTDENTIKQNLHIEPLYKEDLTYALIQISDMTTTYNRVYKLKNLIKEMEVELKEIQTTEKISRHRAMHDSLTGLPNRLYFNDRLAWAINYAHRNRDKLGIMFLDLDGFKEINDTYGHKVGDMVLREAARRLRGCIRSIDTLARLGGDEFTAVLIQLKDEKDASIVASKFIKVFQDPFIIDEKPIKLSVSIGISTYPKDGEEPTALINKADTAMYKIKIKGKNAFGFAE
ncbi:GGDEF domain-containing protein [Schinkia azotoformans]|uniref:GGDEF domain-containing protein n=1 Tax=Schinkia azotoformans TaxID=1454 RepID=UPI002DB5B8B1|nr:GGDEF domain-containing protein [Schinkia azotoformans]MEC1719031.1 GGDEF domain-containing protein [Schinkia azotoformans]MED4352253.1 GGDEF domain-containing protein [Schinkia azotoformans]MED4411939.1 GGDEF domain-containing protein [Schinkia azotoformans]